MSSTTSLPPIRGDRGGCGYGVNDAIGFQVLGDQVNMMDRNTGSKFGAPVPPSPAKLKHNDQFIVSPIDVTPTVARALLVRRVVESQEFSEQEAALQKTQKTVERLKLQLKEFEQTKSINKELLSVNQQLHLERAHLTDRCTALTVETQPRITKIGTLQQLLTQKTNENEYASAKIFELKATGEELRKVSDTLTATCETLQQRLHVSQVEKEEMQREAREAEVKSKGEIERLTEELKNVSLKLDREKDKNLFLEELKKEKVEWYAKAELMQKQLDTAEDAHQGCDLTIFTLTQSFEHLQTEHTALQSQHTALEEQMSKVQAEHASCGRESSSSRAQIARLMHAGEDLNRQISSLKAASEKFPNTIIDLQQQLEGMSAKAAFLQTSLETVQISHQSCQHAHARCLPELQSVQRNLEFVQKANQTYLRELEDAREAVADAIASHEGCSVHAERLEEEVSKLNAAVDMQKTLVAQRDEALLDMQVTHMRCEPALHLVQARCKDLEAKHLEDSTRIQMLTLALSDLKTAMDSVGLAFQAKVDQLEKNAVKITGELERVGKELEGEIKQHADVKEQFVLAQEKVKSLLACQDDLAVYKEKDRLLETEMKELYLKLNRFESKLFDAEKCQKLSSNEVEMATERINELKSTVEAMKVDATETLTELELTKVQLAQMTSAKDSVQAELNQLLYERKQNALAAKQT